MKINMFLIIDIILLFFITNRLSEAYNRKDIKTSNMWSFVLGINILNIFLKAVEMFMQ